MSKIMLRYGVEGDAVFSDDRKYRKWLSRDWRPQHSEPFTRFALWIGLNPSTADAFVDDQTIMKETRFTANIGLSCYVKTNIADYIATFQEDLLAATQPIASVGNLDMIAKFAVDAERVIVAWGDLNAPQLKTLANACIDRLITLGIRIECLGKTKLGAPRHPSRLPYDTRLEIY